MKKASGRVAFYRAAGGSGAQLLFWRGLFRPFQYCLPEPSWGFPILWCCMLRAAWGCLRRCSWLA